jgi:hypothetical protein
MKKVFLSCICTLFIITAFAQPIPPQSIEDSILGWMKVYHFRGATKGIKVDDKVYSAHQLSICDSFANWMQASYMPKGGLGDIKRSVSEKLGLYNQDDAALPQAYGAYTKTYLELKYNSSNKMEPLTNSHELWSIMANAPVGIPAAALCTPAQYYFTLPSFAEQGYDGEMPKLYELTTHPNTKKYFTYFRRNSAIGNEKTVLLYKENTSPFIKVTKGEYLQVVEAAITRLYEKEKKSINEKEKNNQRNINYFMKYLDEKHAKRMATLKINKEKYKDQLQETAKIFTDQPDVLLENYPDVFQGSGAANLKLPVYKIDPVIAERCKKDQPQWIRITWHGDINHPVGKHQHESIINNFNFDYVYNFFFDSEKVKHQSYKPLHSPVYKEAVAAITAQGIARKNSGDKNIFFFEDFSTTIIGKKPIGWGATLAREGTTAVVVNPGDLEGNWVELKGHHINATALKKPLPQNFTLTYDIAVPQNFTWGTKGLTIQLAKETSPGNAESYMKLKLRPGYNGNDGEATLEIKFPSPPGYSNGTKWYVAPGFSNDKKINSTKVTIKKAGEMLQVFIDKNKIAEYEKAIPHAHLFNALSFDCSGNSAENDKFFISNIKITKED